MIVAGKSKPSPSELYQFGVKGMHWGQHKAASASKKPRTAKEFAARKELIKKRAIKFAYSTVLVALAVGSAYADYKIGQSRELRLDQIRQRGMATGFPAHTALSNVRRKW